MYLQQYMNFSVLVADVTEILNDHPNYDPDTLLHMIIVGLFITFLYWLAGVCLLRIFVRHWPMHLYGCVLFLVSNSAWFLSKLGLPFLQVLALGHSCGLDVLTRYAAYIYTALFNECVADPGLPLLLLHVGVSIVTWLCWCSDIHTSFARMQEEPQSHREPELVLLRGSIE